MTCPECNSSNVEVNAWEAWCFDCEWRTEAPDPMFDQIRAAEMERRSQVSEADVAAEIQRRKAEQ